MKRLVPIMAALLALAACDSQPIQHTPMAPTVRLAAVPGRPAAGYFELIVDGDLGALVSVTSPQARRVEMHETMSAGNMTSMHPLARIPVRGGERLIFAPGGRHLMLFDMDPAVRPGSEIALVLNFERGPPRALSATATSAGGETH
jgi:periplasmic copper chaperone A